MLPACVNGAMQAGSHLLDTNLTIPGTCVSDCLGVDVVLTLDKPLENPAQCAVAVFRVCTASHIGLKNSWEPQDRHVYFDLIRRDHTKHWQSREAHECTTPQHVVLCPQASTIPCGASNTFFSM